MQGQAGLSDDPGAATAIAARYVGPDRAQEFGQRNGVPGELVVRVRPTRVLAYFNMTSRSCVGFDGSGSVDQPWGASSHDRRRPGLDVLCNRRIEPWCLRSPLPDLRGNQPAT